MLKCINIAMMLKEYEKIYHHNEVLDKKNSLRLSLRGCHVNLKSCVQTVVTAKCPRKMNE